MHVFDRRIPGAKSLRKPRESMWPVPDFSFSARRFAEALVKCKSYKLPIAFHETSFKPEIAGSDSSD